MSPKFELNIKKPKEEITEREEHLQQHVLCQNCRDVLGQLGESDQVRLSEDRRTAAHRYAKAYRNAKPHILENDCSLCAFVSDFLQQTSDTSIAQDGFKMFPIEGLSLVPCDWLKSGICAFDDFSGRYEWEARFGKIEFRHDNVKVVEKVFKNLHEQTPRIDFEPIRYKIQACREQHANCQRLTKHLEQPSSPIKLINCYTRQLVAATPQDLYLTLSYVWGQGSESHNTSILPGQHLPTQLPTLIEDALETTKKLGFDYLWIDRYCINQSNKSELKAQVSQMDLIYGRAICCIIPFSADHPEMRIPGVSRPRSTLPERRIFSTTFTATPPISTEQEIQDSRWYTRGWTYQEAVLSRQRLFIGTNTLLWHCLSDTFSDIYLPSLHKTIPYSLLPTLERLPNDFFLDFEHAYRRQISEAKPPYFSPWSRQPRMDKVQTRGAPALIDHLWRHISTYSKRNLTNPRDVLSAIQGVFNALKSDAFSSDIRVEQKEVFQPFYGLPICYKIAASDDDDGAVPRQNFTQKLLETLPYAVDNSDRGTCYAIRRPGQPSWSWASRVGETIPPFSTPEGDDVSFPVLPKGAAVEVELSEDGQMTRVDWNRFCEQNLTGSALDICNNPLARLEPVLTVHGTFFPVVVDDGQGPGEDEVDYFVIGHRAREQAQLGSKMCIELGRLDWAGSRLPDLETIHGVILAYLCIVFEGTETEQPCSDGTTIAFILLQGTGPDGDFERIGSAWMEYKGGVPLQERFERLCERYPKYKQLSDTGLRIV